MLILKGGHNDAINNGRYRRISYHKKISGCDDTKRFLESLGFIVGSEVSIVSKLGQNFIINVKDTRVAIDQTMAKRIFV